MYQYRILLYLCIVLLTACKTMQPVNNTVYSDTEKHASEQNNLRKLDDIALNGKVYTSIWQQNAGEFRALCYQAFNIAKINIDNKLLNQELTRPLAIITDIDETFLDNSPYAVTQALQGHEFSYSTWLEWTSQGKAIAYPGALDFFNYAASKNITVFYITNRNEQDKPGTLNNLQDLKFPFADNEHLLVMRNTSDKEERRQAVLKNYDVIMYLGDNLSDFSEVFYKKSQTERNKLTDELFETFGDKFIILPNAGYGDWETALPGFNYNLSPAQKDSVYLKNLIGY